jgi:hypothetical protein
MEFEIGDLVKFKTDSPMAHSGNVNRPFVVVSVIVKRTGQKRELLCRIVAAESVMTVDPSELEPYLTEDAVAKLNDLIKQQE